MKKVSRESAGNSELVCVGIDLGDRWSHWCGLSSEGEVVSRGRVRTEVEAMGEQGRQWSGVRVAIENGTHSGWVSRTLSGCGCEVVVANPSRWRGTAHSSKNDANDAEALARVARVDPRLLFPLRHRGQAEQEDLAVVRVRAQLVKSRTQLVNTARGVVKSLGGRLGRADAEYFTGRTWDQVPAGLRAALGPLYELLVVLNEQIGKLDERIEQLSRKCYPQAMRLRSVPGVGPVTALTYVLTVADPHRFTSSRQAGAYLGLRPRQRQSGERDPQLGIAKNGDGYLRSLLVECAHYVLSRGPDSALKRWGLALAGGGTRPKRRALVAVARKLAVLLHTLWVRGQSFRPFPEETVDAEARAHRSLRAATAAD